MPKTLLTEVPIASQPNGSIVWQGPPDEAKDVAMHCLKMLFSGSLGVKERDDILQRQFAIPKTSTMESELNEMSGLGAAIKQQTRLEYVERAAGSFGRFGIPREQMIVERRRQWPEVDPKEIEAAVDRTERGCGGKET